MAGAIVVRGGLAVGVRAAVAVVETRADGAGRVDGLIAGVVVV